MRLIGKKPYPNQYTPLYIFYLLSVKITSFFMYLGHKQHTQQMEQNTKCTYTRSTQYLPKKYNAKRNTSVYNISIQMYVSQNGTQNTKNAETSFLVFSFTIFFVCLVVHEAFSLVSSYRRMTTIKYTINFTFNIKAPPYVKLQKYHYTKFIYHRLRVFITFSICFTLINNIIQMDVQRPQRELGETFKHLHIDESLRQMLCKT